MSANKIKKSIADEIERIISKCGSDVDVTEVLTLPLLRLLPLAAVEGWEDHSYPSGKEFVRLAASNLNDDALKNMLNELKAITDETIAKAIEEENENMELAKSRRTQREKEEKEDELHVSKTNTNIIKAHDVWSKLLHGRLKRYIGEFLRICSNEPSDIISYKLNKNIEICRRILTISDEVHQELNDIHSLLTNDRALLIKVEDAPLIDIVDKGIYWEVLAKEDINIASNAVTVVDLGISLALSTPLTLFNYLVTREKMDVACELISRRGRGALLFHCYSNEDIKISTGTSIVEIRGL